MTYAGEEGGANEGKVEEEDRAALLPQLLAARLRSRQGVGTDRAGLAVLSPL